ncbi:trypsin-like peptidase domain-containing protein [Flavobacterium supellecticarium]|uniref:Trypsin-like peptidase domain-containing protein n=1 Tax=Flavobacterium supellecticarium TaxID=2565924 RepID=A0A4S4A3Y3_9FLAO|nr:serine protease [Flavobacterium supellecticarium]THF53151.1 trypsin-like peptidase domain-containing protein [Flavobacterium supellecticarium]
MKKNKWTPYRHPNDEEQQIFQELLGNEIKVEALLVSNNEHQVYTEYIFLYNHPNDDNNNLVSFYAKVDLKKELIKISTAQLTEKMILRNTKEVAAGFPLLENVTKSIGLKYSGQIFLDHDILTVPNYRTSSQATYFFDCDGNGFNSNGTINEDSPKGSFCCILSKKNEYYILTAAHNLKKVKGAKEYRLIRDKKNVVPLQFVEYYIDSKNDAAILKIGEKVPEDLWNNRISFHSAEIPENKIPVVVVGHEEKVIESAVVDSSEDTTPYHFGLSNGGEYGMSGGPVFNKTNNSKLYGMYLGTGNTACVKYLKIENKNSKISKDYTLC